MPRLVALLALASLALAGCVTPPSDVEAASAPRTAIEALPHLELTDAHDHKDRASHAASWNVETLGWNPIAPDGTKLGRYNHVVTQGGLAFVTAYALEKGAPGGLAILDVTGDEPALLSTFEMPDLTPIDVDVSGDGKYVVVAGHRDNRVTLPAAAQACTGTPMVDVCTPFVPSGVYLFDVTDPKAPKRVGAWTSLPSGAHTAKVEEIDGEHYVFIASYGFAYASRLASHVEILHYNKAAPGGARLEPAAKFFAPESSGNDGARRVFVHDMFVEPHPDGRLLMYVSYWDGGVVIADVTDPKEPRHVATWKDFDAATYGNVHFARPIGVIDGRHITMAAPEYGSAEHSGEMYVLDTTDPAKPKLLSKWTLPGDPVNDGNYRFSPHNFDPDGTRVAYAHYHGGVWVLDLAIPEAPAVVGYTVPIAPLDVAIETEEDAGNVWAAVWTDAGTLLASDIGTGLHHYRVVSDAPGTPPYEAFLG